ncbi:hypothetical protein [Novosphingobium album (ex Hu et al. 2023)]|uniref:Uncharacterized protein n=1 Tax=Novosphingobium album (ex Hu et al. 2023) TaxID=2930093 RepID=A0ABT0B3G1_9SPHN|nr:hypothetical protein [Novosphingobium album (ex Hu et al. 2023)]MCJ2179576.1 hypothetical protein [Novosphingobium album (ex Hu et al. 2023)]
MRHGKLAFLALSLIAAPALAQNDGPTFDKGPVWDFADIKTVDGHFDDYMAWLAGPWKEQQEAMKKAGYIMDYKVMLVSDPREGEPDIILATQYANMAAFDHSTADEYSLGKKIWGSMSKANQEQAARSSIRTVMGDMLVREAILK